MSAVSHVGLCVADLDRATRFYTRVFGFVVRNEMTIPDRATGPLLAVATPVGLTARYLMLEGFVLELLHFDRPESAVQRDRPFTELGLTHLSFTVDNLESACALVRDSGGRVLDERTIPGVVAMVIDPDGQILEVLQS